MATYNNLPFNSRYANPGFDPRISSLANLQATSEGTGVNTGDLQRGYMITDKGYASGNIQYAARFLYNPSEIDESHSVDLQSNTVITPQQYRGADTGDYNVPVNASVSFNLYYDRTYELWDASPQAPRYDMSANPNQRGVLVDVEAIFRVAGIYRPVTGALPPEPKSAPPSILSNGPMQPMAAIPSTVYFGGSNSLQFRGYIGSLSISWIRFSQLMVPMSCVVSVTYQLLPATR